MRVNGTRVPLTLLVGLLIALGSPLGADPAVASSAQQPLAAYIVVLNAGLNPAAVSSEHAKSVGGTIKGVYRKALNGYSINLPAQRVAALRADPRVASMELDGEMRAAGQTSPWGINRIRTDISTTKAGNGSGAVGVVNAYVIDSGISKHTDLNLVGHLNWTGDGKNYDCAGHGTHVAGIVGARDNAAYGVGSAPGVALTGLKVLGCNGSGNNSWIIAALEWVMTYGKKPAIVNLSLSGAPSAALDSAVVRSAQAGVLHVVAAGNNGANACDYSPARAGAGTDNGIVTVAATDTTNTEASFSNYGSCVDIWAPGVSIVSTSRTGGTVSMSGTSMAAPHVTGTAALYRSRYVPASAANAEKILKANVVSFGKYSKDRRLIKSVYAGRY